MVNVALFMGAFCQPRFIAVYRRICAAGSAALVFVLGLLASSPALHHQLHTGLHGAGDDHCAVVLFANGVSAPVAMSALPPPVREWQDHRPTASVEVYVGSPRYRLQPERGPPGA